MYKFAIAAAAAALALTGSAATAQMRDTHTTTTMQGPMGTTTTTRMMDHRIDGPNGTRTMERTTVRSHNGRTVMHDRHDMRGPNRSWHSNRNHCKTWWSHGRKMRSCRAPMRNHR